jgi:hypothetical protein
MSGVAPSSSSVACFDLTVLARVLRDAARVALVDESRRHARGKLRRSNKVVKTFQRVSARRKQPILNGIGRIEHQNCKLLFELPMPAASDQRERDGSAPRGV